MAAVTDLPGGADAAAAWRAKYMSMPPALRPACSERTDQYRSFREKNKKLNSKLYEIREKNGFFLLKVHCSGTCC